MIKMKHNLCITCKKPLDCSIICNDKMICRCTDCFLNSIEKGYSYTECSRNSKIKNYVSLCKPKLTNQQIIRIIAMTL